MMSHQGVRAVLANEKKTLITLPGDTQDLLIVLSQKQINRVSIWHICQTPNRVTVAPPNGGHISHIKKRDPQDYFSTKALSIT
jgi:hypothetical protein